jgi:hypothetical protein
LLLGDLLINIIDGLAVEFGDVLESVNNKGFEGFAVEDLIINYDQIL